MANDVIAKIFGKIDADNSGSICESEMSSAFKDFDRDGNGSVSRDEWVENFMQQFGATNDQALTAFKNLDAAGAGEILLDDLIRLFGRMDSDGNGSVTKEEFFEFWVGLLQV
jgi:hypothetical protein